VATGAVTVVVATVVVAAVAVVVTGAADHAEKDPETIVWIDTTVG